MAVAMIVFLVMLSGRDDKDDDDDDDDGDVDDVMEGDEEKDLDGGNDVVSRMTVMLVMTPPASSSIQSPWSSS